MNGFELLLYRLNELRMDTPVTWGWFHLMWIGIIVLCVVITFLTKRYYNEKQLKWALGLYGIVTLILELIKQIMWAFNYDNGVVSWAYSWYSAPFQLCTTPMFVSIIALFLKKGKFRDSLLSYLSFYIVVTSLMVLILPESCFTSQIIINVHTMYLHAMSLALALYLLINKEVEVNRKNLFNAFKVFISFVFIALFLDVIVYKSGILNGETFNMFYISPYFPCTLPFFELIYDKVSYPLFLLLYIMLIFLGSCFSYFILKYVFRRR